MKRVLLAVLMVGLLAILVAPLWYALEHPEVLPTLPERGAAESLATVTLVSAPVLVPSPSQIPLAAAEEPGVEAIITGWTVNLRDEGRKATGMTVLHGEAVRVIWEADGFGEIVEPPRWAGLYVWRGCTSDPAGYGCEAK